jgi:S-(hydroxymethyl)glutathione dehydrogenase/alcohol dehydrogenase
VDPVETKRTTALELGATEVLDAVTPEELVELVRARTGGRGADVAFEAAGRVDTTLAAYRMTRRAGTVVAVGAADSKATLDLGAWEHVSSGKNFRGSLAGDAHSDRDLPILVRLAETGRLDVGRMVTRRVGLDADAILGAFSDGSGIRTVVTP